jgi:glycosyltransferase involved in cell wall biosynthesis
MSYQKPLVSIIIPVFNRLPAGALYLKQAIDSVLQQTYSSIEVIVVNDGAIDEGACEQVALSYGDKIRYYVKENGGTASALNYGIGKMQGAYFSWLSHDDRYLPDKIANQMKLMSRLKNKSTLLYSGYDLIDSQSNHLRQINPAKRFPKARLNQGLFPVVRGLINGCTVLIHKKCFDEIGLFDESLPTTQDYDLWFRLFRRFPVRFDASIQTQCRQHPDQASKTIDNHLTECEHLWTGFLDKINLQEMRDLDGSPYRFFKHMAAFLSETPYAQSADYALKRADEVLADIKISVIIPFYNRIEFVLEAIASVQDQTHENVEIILVDDGSTESVAPLRQLMRADERLRWVEAKENRGPSFARNMGVRAASGSYVAFLDSDDLFSEDKLRYQLSWMEENACLISHTAYNRVDKKNRFLERVALGSDEATSFPRIVQVCQIATPTVMLKRDLVKDALFVERYRVGEDVCLWIKLASQHDIRYIRKPLTSVRYTPDSTANDKRSLDKGLINIAHYVINDDSLSGCEPEIHTLLENIKWRFSSGPAKQAEPNDLRPLVSEDDVLLASNDIRTGFIRSRHEHIQSLIRKLMIKFQYMNYLISRFVYCVRHDGLKVALKKVKKVLFKSSV